jgi:hypothetical protein
MRHCYLRLLPLVLCACLAASAQSAPSHFVGVNAHQPSPDVLDAAKDLGVSWIRIDLNWFQVEPTRGSYNWAPFDAIIDGAIRRGLKVFPTLAYGPAWATEADGDGIASNNTPKPGEYQKFCQAVAARYAGKITHFGLWNEPNLAGFFEGTRQQWIDRVVIEGARGIKAGCPSCFVLGPELATVGKDYATYLDSALKAMRAVGLRFDIVTWHIYANFVEIDPGLLLCTGDTFQNKLDAHRVCKLGGVTVYEGPRSVREILLDNGMGDIPVWITETGRTAPLGDSKRTAEQVTYYRRVLEEQLRRSWYQNSFFYEIVDDNAIADKWGMAVRMGSSYPAAYSRKPVWNLLKQALRNPAFGGAGSECDDGLDNDGDRRIDFPKDPDCTSAADPKEAAPLWPVHAATAAATPEAEWNPAEEEPEGDVPASVHAVPGNPADRGEVLGGCSMTPRTRGTSLSQCLLPLTALVLLRRRRQRR